MTQVLSIVKDAMFHLRVLDPSETPEAAESQDAIRVLNMMMRRWEADGLALGWTDVTNTTDTLPLPPEAEEAVGYNLAVKLRPRYGVAIDPDVQQAARDGLASLRADYLSQQFNRISYDDLPNTPSGGRLASFLRGFNG